MYIYIYIFIYMTILYHDSSWAFLYHQQQDRQRALILQPPPVTRGKGRKHLAPPVAAAPELGDAGHLQFLVPHDIALAYIMSDYKLRPVVMRAAGQLWYVGTGSAHKQEGRVRSEGAFGSSALCT